MENSIKSEYEKVWEGFYLRTFVLIKEHKWKWQGIGALIGVGGGLLSLVTAVLLDLIVWSLRVSHLRTSLHSKSLIFYVFVLPLLGLGSHCLDLLEEKISITQSDDLQPPKFDLGLEK